MRLELEKKKQDNLSLEKQLIKERETGEVKAQEIMAATHQQTNQFAEQLRKLDLMREGGDNMWDAREKLSNKVSQL